MLPNKHDYLDTSNTFSLTTDPSFACETVSLLNATILFFFSLIMSMTNAERQKISWKIEAETFLWRFEKGVWLPSEKTKKNLKKVTKKDR